MTTRGAFAAVLSPPVGYTAASGRTVSAALATLAPAALLHLPVSVRLVGIVILGLALVPRWATGLGWSALVVCLLMAQFGPGERSITRRGGRVWHRRVGRRTVLCGRAGRSAAGSGAQRRGNVVGLEPSRFEVAGDRIEPKCSFHSCPQRGVRAGGKGPRGGWVAALHDVSGRRCGQQPRVGIAAALQDDGSSALDGGR